jgi:hypothetical protein
VSGYPGLSDGVAGSSPVRIGCRVNGVQVPGATSCVGVQPGELRRRALRQALFCTARVHAACSRARLCIPVAHWTASLPRLPQGRGVCPAFRALGVALWGGHARLVVCVASSRSSSATRCSVRSKSGIAKRFDCSFFAWMPLDRSPAGRVHVGSQRGKDNTPRLSLCIYSIKARRKPCLPSA